MINLVQFCAICSKSVIVFKINASQKSKLIDFYFVLSKIKILHMRSNQKLL